MFPVPFQGDLRFVRKGFIMKKQRVRRSFYAI